jgi:hypothetical protein
VDYVGGDIVSPLIETLNSQYRNKKTRFIHIDLTKDAFPKVDLMICRDCLFHLPFEDARLILKNFIASKSSYFLSTTHQNHLGFKNRDIQTGDFRRIDLFAAPYFLPATPLRRIDDWIPPHPEREICLWSREQVMSAISSEGRGDIK